VVLDGVVNTARLVGFGATNEFCALHDGLLASLQVLRHFGAHAIFGLIAQKILRNLPIGQKNDRGCNQHLNKQVEFERFAHGVSSVLSR
jgi:hypothetical protein